MNGRRVEFINDHWKFSKLPIVNKWNELEVELFPFDDEKWEDVTLPHTYNNIDGCNGRSGEDEGGEHYYRGLTGYRRNISFEKANYDGKVIFVEFEGANTVTDLYINEKYVGRHSGGFSKFRFDITDFIKLDSENLFVVKVNNAPTDYCPPLMDQGDFTKMGGIYRDVKIVTTNKAHIDLLDYASSGVYVTPKNISSKKSDLDVKVKLKNDYAEAKDIKVEVKILDMKGNSVCVMSDEIAVLADKNATVNLSGEILNPVLWHGRKNPYLYGAEVSVFCDDTLMDKYIQPFGVRTLRFDDQNGFYLNGEYMELRGVNLHQDSFENGWAMSDSQRERDYGIICEMGCNSVRMAHYQHDEYEYDLCDKLGLTVWTEVGIVNMIAADRENVIMSEAFPDNAKLQFTELIRQNYNHPSIILWGISNELFQMSDPIFELYTELYNLGVKEDPTRPKTHAASQFWGRFLSLPSDVVGYNKYFGWYKDVGSLDDLLPWFDEYHQHRELRPLCVSEYGAGGATTQYKDNIVWEEDIDPWGKRHYENYQSYIHEILWSKYSSRRYLFGKYIWCMFDFASDGRTEGDTCGINDKGMVTRERMRKDTFFFYKSVWNEEPMVYLTQRRFYNRPSLVPEVKAYSNAPKTELFVNGASLGFGEKLKNNKTVFVWPNVQLEIGVKNIVRVVSYFEDGKTLEDEVYWIGE